MSTSLLVPLKTDAFILNEDCCNSDDYKIAPISQPNYTFLRLDNHLLEADLLDHVDLHAAKPAYLNPRLYDLGTGQLRRNRLGVYLHWVLPPFYRQGEARAPDENVEADPNERAKAGFPSRSADEPGLDDAAVDESDPSFRPVPNRWLVVRRLKPGSYSPANANIDTIQAWVIQSDALRTLSVDPSLDNLDLEVDVSPFVDTDMVKDGKPRDDIIETQAEVFVGKKVSWDEWDPAQADQEPSIDLNVMTSANPLLVDYQVHNPNIFSTIDNFGYQENGQTKYLDEAVADYCVIGWHSEDDDDPMTTASRVIDDDVPSHEERMRDLEMKLKDYDVDDNTTKQWIEDATEWLAERQGPARSDSRIVCHSNMYDVHWKKDGFPQDFKIQADEVAQCQKKIPFSMGTSDLDALMAHWDTLATVTDDLAGTRDQIRRLRYILGEAGDGDVDGLQRFSDEAYKMAFDRVDGGTAWFWKAEKSDAQPSTQDITDLDRLNMDQAALDNVSREVDDLRWKIFAVWWTWVSSFELQNMTDLETSGPAKRLTEVLERLEVLLGTRAENESNSVLKKLKDRVQSKAQGDIHSKGTANRFYQRKDPTALFSSIGSGWEPDFQDAVKVRRHTEAVKAEDGWNQKWDSSRNLVQLADKAPEEVQPGVKAALEEFYALRNTGLDLGEKIVSQVLPHFYDGTRDRWNNIQPWKPLFLEWEALYYHIPYEKWDCHEYEEENNYGASAIHYHVPEDVNVSQIFDGSQAKPDVIRISGRDNLHPQAVGTFKVLVEEVFDNSNPQILAENLGVELQNPDDPMELFDKLQEVRSNMVQTLAQMQFVSSPLSAVSNSLLTVREGAHMKPLLRLPHSTPVALPGAAEKLRPILPANRDPVNVLQLVNDQGDITPYASSVTVDRENYPFKPVQHGQLQFIKLNIVDKFGQAVHLIDPTPPPMGKFFTTSPIISKSLFVGEYLDPVSNQTRPNTAVKQEDPNACPFIALPPAMNQPARMNACFVQKVQETVGGPWVWRRISDWDTPVWGWVVVNYADSGIQIFEEDGQFYREIRFSSSREGQVVSPKYLPFDPPVQEDTGRTKQLDYLIKKLTTEPNYLLAFWDMINKSFANASFSEAPTSYSNFSTAVIGKPLALVNAGWSIELAHQPRVNWASTEFTTDVHPKRTLLNPDGERWSERQWDETQPNEHGYTFPVKIGDDARRYDGLVGYFLPKESDSTNPTERGPDLDVNYFYTFPAFAEVPDKKQPSDPRVSISKENYPRHTPYWMTPESLADADNLERHDDKLKVLGLLIDPFLPVHAFSAILPTKGLQLPAWTVERALKRMWAFWHAGPLLTTRDVAPTFDTDRRLDARYGETLAKLTTGKTLEEKDDAGEAVEAGAPAPVIKLPLAPPAGAQNGGGAAFVYLQPYRMKEEGSEVVKTAFNPYAIDPESGVGVDAEEARLEKGPYTAVEGYVQIVKSLSDEFGG